MSGEQTKATSDIFDPAWRPGAAMRRRAERYGRKHGLDYAEALEKVIEIVKDKQRANLLYNARVSEEAAELAPLRPGTPYPQPRSVRDFPAGGFETNRRRH